MNDTIPRRLESPAITAALVAVVGLVFACAGFVEGTKVRQCPTALEDGRRLVRQELRPTVCHYAPPPRGLEMYSSTELRRIANGRDRMERLK